jgi:hypothetical protein
MVLTGCAVASEGNIKPFPYLAQPTQLAGPRSAGPCPFRRSVDSPEALSLPLLTAIGQR